MVLVDTGFLVALLNNRDALHHRARAWMRVETSPRLITEQVYFEVINQFSTAGTRHLAAVAHRWVFENPRVEFIASTSEMMAEAWRFFIRHADKEWSLTDCVSFVVLKRRGIATALAHDIHFEQAGFVALLRRDP